MLLNRRSSDFFCKTIVIFERIISCGRIGTTSNEVSRLCQDSIPLAMSSLGGGDLISGWQNIMKINEFIARDMSGSVNYDTGDVTYKTSKQYFGNDEDGYVSKADLAADSIHKMRCYADDSLKILNSHLISVLHEWSDAKSTYIDIDDIVEDEKKVVREAADKEINNIINELSTAFIQLEQARDAVKENTKKVEVATVELTLLRPVPQKLESSEAKVRDLMNKIKGITDEAEKEIMN